MRRSTLPEIPGPNNEQFVEKGVKKSPGWCEARYFRTIEWLAQGDGDKRDYVLLWVFSLLEGQFGFAIDLGAEYERIFGQDDIARIMKQESVRCIKQGYSKMQLQSVISLPYRIVQRLRK